MKIRRFRSFRFKLVLYMILSVLATILTEVVIFGGIYLYETRIVAGEYRQIWGGGSPGFQGFTFSESASRDVMVIIVFTILLMSLYFILFLNPFVSSHIHFPKVYLQ